MNLLEQLKSSTILADGAMGTMLHSRGISFEKCFDELESHQSQCGCGDPSRIYRGGRTAHIDQHLWSKSL